MTEDMKTLEKRIVTLKIVITCLFVLIFCTCMLLWERAVSEGEYRRLSKRVEQLEQMHGYTIDSTPHSRGHNE